MTDELIPQETIENKILFIRDEKVMLDKDLAKLYDVKPIALRQQVKRNKDRFPKDFMFQLSGEETQNLLSQNVIPSMKNLGGYLPFAFTEQGVAMLSSVLNSKRAIMINIQIMRAFTKLRKTLSNYKGLKEKVEEMEEKYDYKFKVVFDAIKQLLEPPEKEVKRIGFNKD